jgi:hypothetical protein
MIGKEDRVLPNDIKVEINQHLTLVCWLLLLSFPYSIRDESLIILTSCNN